MAFIKKKPPGAGGEPAGAAPPPGNRDSRSTPRDFAGLIAELTEAEPTKRRWAARDLLDYPEAAGALVAQLRVEGDLSVREVILTSLTRLGNETAVTGLIDCLRSEDVQMRNAAIEAMKALPDAMAPIMSGLLIDADPDVRILALNILESLRHPKVEEWLIDVIDDDPLVNVCGAAVDLLGEVGSAASHDALERLKRRFPAEPYIQFAADLALKRIATA